jgi:signal transduction histidine kinase
MGSDAEPQGPERQLRMAAALALFAAVVLYPIQAYYTPAPASRPLLLILGLHVAITGLVLVASLTGAGTRRADRLTVALVGGVTGNLLLYVYLMPYTVPTYPTLTAYAITFLLIMGAVLFSWSQWRVTWMGLASCTVFAFVGWSVAARGFDSVPFWITGAWLIIGVAVSIGCARTLGASRASLLQRQHDLTALSARLISVQEEQLRRLSRELHDELGQSLTAVSSYLWLLEQQMSPQQSTLRARTGEARRLVASTLGQIRELSQLLRPPVLDLYGLVPSLEQHLRSFEQRHNIAASFLASGLPERLPSETETAIYRITQEALTNVARHAHARRVRVQLNADDEHLHLEIEDDGRGLADDDGKRGGVGLIGIRERVRALGGTMNLESAAGVQLAVHIPLESPPAVPRQATG